MTEIVLDTCALIALIRQEPGADIVEAYKPHYVMSAVNVAEAGVVLIRNGMSPAQAEQAIRDAVPRIVPLNDRQAFLSSALYPFVKSCGLSLGDRCCLALGQDLGLPVLTAEHIWRKLDLPVGIRWIR